jgi:putative FmdB family regulatory protein
MPCVWWFRRLEPKPDNMERILILYEYECPEHGQFDEFNTVDDRDTMVCPQCGKKSKKLMSASHVYMDFTPGYDPSLNTWVDTKAQRERICEEKGLKRYKD